jgi:predicted RNA binding protein YcfA (HicA-like mRNA interferase family)
MNTTRTFASRDFVRILTKAGFVKTRQTGSHMQFEKGDRHVVVPAGRKDMKIGTARSICRQAGLPWPPE